MAVEIELKVHLDDYEALKERLSAVGTYCRSYHKSDSYWFSPQLLDSGVRIRRESGHDADGTAYESAMVTFKNKTISQGIEVNDEREFTVSDAALFEELLYHLGMDRDIRKEKNGWAWNVTAEDAAQPILAELSLVTGLGWFLELEIISPGDRRQEIAESRQRLLALLAVLEIPEDRIESRPYSQMLKELDCIG